MRLVGYIKEKKHNSFAIPVYSGKEKEFFFHHLDDSYTIIGFKVAQLNTTKFKKVYLSKNFNLGSKGAIVFLGKEGYLKYDDAENAITEITNYIKDCYTFETVGTLLEESISIKKSVFKIVEIQNKIVSIKPDKDPLILAFDLPLIKEEIAIQEFESPAYLEEKKEKPSKKIKLEQISDPAFKNEIKRLNVIEKNYELMLKMRSEDRRKKLKTFNYQFHFSQKVKNE